MRNEQEVKEARDMLTGFFKVTPDTDLFLVDHSHLLNVSFFRVYIFFSEKELPNRIVYRDITRWVGAVTGIEETRLGLKIDVGGMSRAFELASVFSQNMWPNIPGREYTDHSMVRYFVL